MPEEDLLTQFLTAHDVWQHQILVFVGEVPGSNRKSIAFNYFSIMLTCSHLYECVNQSDLFLYLKFVYCGTKFEKLPALLPSPELTMRSRMIEKGSKLCRLERIHFQYIHACATDDYRDRFLGMMKYVTWKIPDFLSFNYTEHADLSELKRDVLEILDIVKDKVLTLEVLLKVKPLVLKNVDYLKQGRMFQLETFIERFAKFLSNTKLSDEELISWKPALFRVFEFSETDYLYEFGWLRQLQNHYPDDLQEIVLRHPHVLKYIYELQHDKAVAMKAIMHDWKCFKYLGEELASDPEVLKLAVKRSNCSTDLEYSTMINNREFLLEVLPYCELKVVSHSVLWSDPSFVEKALSIDPKTTISCIMDMNSHPTVDLNEFKTDFIRKLDRGILLKVLRKNGNLLQRIPEELVDQDMVLAAVNSAEKLKEIPLVKWSQVPEIARAMARHGYLPSAHLYNDKDIVIEFMKFDGYSWQFTLFKDDRDVALTAVSSYGRILEKLPSHFQRDREIIATALKNNGEAIKFVPKPICSELDVVLAAVRSNGTALRWLPDHFRRNRVVVLAACKSSVAALKYAAPELQNDKEMISAAVIYHDELYF